jgi:hypothetical protein
VGGIDGAELDGGGGSLEAAAEEDEGCSCTSVNLPFRVTVVAEGSEEAAVVAAETETGACCIGG